MGGIIASAERKRLVRGSGGYPAPENFQFWRLRNAILSTCHEICLRKIDLEYENGKQLQVTLIKTTKSKENKSINRLELSDSTGPGGSCPPCPPPLDMARMSIKSDKTRLCFKLSFSLKITRKIDKRKTEVFEAV